MYDTGRFPVVVDDISAAEDATRTCPLPPPRPGTRTRTSTTTTTTTTVAASSSASATTTTRMRTSAAAQHDETRRGIILLATIPDMRTGYQYRFVCRDEYYLACYQGIIPIPDLRMATMEPRTQMCGCGALRIVRLLSSVPFRSWRVTRSKKKNVGVTRPGRRRHDDHDDNDDDRRTVTPT